MMKSKLIVGTAVAALLVGGAFVYVGMTTSTPATAWAHAAYSNPASSFVPVTPHALTTYPAIQVIDATPETEIQSLVKKHQIPDEITTISLMNTIAKEKRGLQTAVHIEPTPERVALLQTVIRQGQQKGVYNNAALLSQIIDKWANKDFTHIDQEQRDLEAMVTLYTNASQVQEASQAASTKEQQKAFKQELGNHLEAKQAWDQKHFEAVLQEWMAAPHTNQAPYQLSVSERKAMADKVYGDHKPTTLIEAIQEMEQMYAGTGTFTYERYVALSYVLNTGSIKAESAKAGIVIPMPYFPYSYDDLATSASVLHQSYDTFYQYIQALGT
ncbi:hypothetical protein L2089_15935 [Paenibacillus hunanensis]|uniref:hypothetical protein n=1 Tax=Paenibacillus hunanensis TaxID=539262 RepID=UPI002025FD4D|nr:hypothetical protein [Paenibacillus hunanensis]MCL9662185.1 hypothetical protein [Paenibacillus hunanensis]